MVHDVADPLNELAFALTRWNALAAATAAAGPMIHVRVVPDEDSLHATGLYQVDHTRLFALARIRLVLVLINFHINHMRSSIDLKVWSFTSACSVDRLVVDKVKFRSGKNIKDAHLLALLLMLDRVRIACRTYAVKQYIVQTT